MKYALEELKVDGFYFDGTSHDFPRIVPDRPRRAKTTRAGSRSPRPLQYHPPFAAAAFIARLSTRTPIPFSAARGDAKACRWTTSSAIRSADATSAMRSVTGVTTARPERAPTTSTSTTTRRRSTSTPRSRPACVSPAPRSGSKSSGPRITGISISSTGTITRSSRRTSEVSGGPDSPPIGVRRAR